MKSGDGGSKKKKIKLYMKDTGIYDINQLFYSAAAPLSTLDEVNKSLSPEDLQKATYTHILNDVKLIDAIQGMLFSYSSITGGNLKKLHLDITSDNPYVGVKRSKLPVHMKPISDAWDNLITGLQQAPDKLKELPDQLQRLMEETKEFPDRAKTIISSSGVGPMEAIKVTQKVMKNISRISCAKEVLNETNKTVEEMKNTLSSLRERLNEAELEKVKEVGKKAHEENLTEPREIIIKHWPEQTRVNLALEQPAGK